jgi:hypothetical protein
MRKICAVLFKMGLEQGQLDRDCDEEPKTEVHKGLISCDGHFREYTSELKRKGAMEGCILTHKTTGKKRFVKVIEPDQRENVLENLLVFKILERFGIKCPGNPVIIHDEKSGKDYFIADDVDTDLKTYRDLREVEESIGRDFRYVTLEHAPEEFDRSSLIKVLMFANVLRLADLNADNIGLIERDGKLILVVVDPMIFKWEDQSLLSEMGERSVSESVCLYLDKMLPMHGQQANALSTLIRKIAETRPFADDEVLVCLKELESKYVPKEIYQIFVDIRDIIEAWPETDMQDSAQEKKVLLEKFESIEKLLQENFLFLLSIFDKVALKEDMH